MVGSKADPRSAILYIHQRFELIPGTARKLVGTSKPAGPPTLLGLPKK